MKKILILIPLFALCFTSCKKWQHRYPEDTERTKKTPEERLTGKTWTLSYASLNGIDYTDSVYQKIGKYQVYFTNSEFDHVSGPGYFKGSAYTGYEGGFPIVWEFSEDKSNMGYIRVNGSVTISTIALLYIKDDIGTGFSAQPGVVLKLNNSELKISRTSKTGDSIIINSFISN